MAQLGGLLAVLDLRPTGNGRFEADSVDSGADGVVFGGQLLAQALVAATRSAPDKEVLSLHTVFARGARTGQPLEIEVEPMHDGRTFTSVSVTVWQAERVCSRTLVLLHEPSADLIRHADQAPPVARADELPDTTTTSGWWERRIVGGVDLADPDEVGPAELRLWTRFSDVPDDLVTSQALLAYATDGFLIGTAMRPHPGVGQSMAHVSIATTVLTHTLSFHEPFHAGDWLLLDQRSTYAGRGRSQGAAEVFTADGRLVASFSQVNMIRHPS